MGERADNRRFDLFVTGTDTGVGKTLIAAALLHWFRDTGLKCAGYKPVSAGCERTRDGLRNDDALTLMQYANVGIEYETVNPYAFEEPIAPHIAAAGDDVRIDLGRITDCFAQIQKQADLVVVEGAGGWFVPLGDEQPLATLADVARPLGLPVLLVVGMRLGCLNHALLTVQAIRSAGLELTGWIANRIDAEFAHADENIAFLERQMPAPLLGIVPHEEKPAPERVAALLEIERLNTMVRGDRMPDSDQAG